MYLLHMGYAPTGKRSGLSTPQRACGGYGDTRLKPRKGGQGYRYMLLRFDKIYLCPNAAFADSLPPLTVSISEAGLVFWPALRLSQMQHDESQTHPFPQSDCQLWSQPVLPS